MRNTFNTQLASLSEEMMAMGALCEDIISDSVRILTENDISIIHKVMETEDKINRLERDIESLCLKLLLHQQPVAGDLRQISSALKMISDMERIGDQATDIAETAKFTSGCSDESEAHLSQMAKEAAKMVTGCISAFADKDLERARAVMKYDDVVDEWFIKIKRELVARIAEDYKRGEYYIDLLIIAKYLERIGDHATNISEWVEYSVTGVHPKG